MSEILHQGQPLANASKAMILLHGRGATAKSILGLADSLCDKDFYVAAPQAANHSWYPHSFLVEEKLNEPFLSDSISSVKRLIDEIAKYIPQNRIYLAGFSQGACLSLEVAARFAAEYGGIIAFTGGLIGAKINEQKYQGNFSGTKIFISNGNSDPHVPLERSEKSKDVLEKLGGKPILKVYNRIQHLISEDEVISAKDYINL